MFEGTIVSDRFSTRVSSVEMKLSMSVDSTMKHHSFQTTLNNSIIEAIHTEKTLRYSYMILP